jgi:hypothetical protein
VLAGKKPVKVYLSDQQNLLADELCKRLGMDKSEVLRHSFLVYAKDLSLLSSFVHGRLATKSL